MSRNSAGLDKPKAAMQVFIRYHSTDGPESLGTTFVGVAVLTGMTLLIKAVAMRE